MIWGEGKLTMSSNQPPDITSFMIRFVHPTDKENVDLVQYHGSIRHIQSNREINFTRWEDAVSFIENYVTLENPEEPLLE